jgi:uncharacterized protein (TIGR02271 family)
MTTQTANYRDWIGRDLVDREGAKIGTIDDLYLDEQTGAPEWLTVTTGLFGTRVSFVPLAEASLHGDEVRVPFDKGQVKDAPNAERDDHLSQDEEAQLYRHYGLDYTTPQTRTGDAPRAATGDDDARTRSDDAMTRSEEELRVGKTSHEAGRVRLRKWVDTEHVEERVPVTREEARIEREPVTSENIDEATSGPAISEDEHEVVLHEEQVVTDKQAVPKERVRVAKEQVTEEQHVEEDLRKERIEEVGDERGRKRA